MWKVNIEVKRITITHLIKLEIISFLPSIIFVKEKFNMISYYSTIYLKKNNIENNMTRIKGINQK